MDTLVTILVPVGIGVYLIAKHLTAAIKAVRSKEWPTVEGEIRESYLGHKDADDRGEIYEPIVRYKYFVEGSGFLSRKLSWNPRTSRDKEKVQSQIDQYPEGGIATVYYNPADPWEAVLKTEAHDTFKRIVTGFAFVIIGFAIAISCASGSWCPELALIETLLQFAG